jgi:hypothetical protein
MSACDGGRVALVPPDSFAGLQRLRAERAPLMRRFHAERRRGHPVAAEILLALDPVLVLDAPYRVYAAQLEAAAHVAEDAAPEVRVGIVRAQARFWTIRGAQALSRRFVDHARSLASGEVLSPIDAALLDFVGLHAAHGLGLAPVLVAEGKLLFRHARAAAPRGEALRLLALALMGRGLTELGTESPARAVDAFEGAIDCARGAGADRTLALALANQSQALRRIDAPERALVTLHKAHGLFTRLGDRLHADHMFGEIVLLAAERGGALDVAAILALARAGERRGDHRMAAHLLLAVLEHGEVGRAPGARLLTRVWSLLGRIDAPDLDQRAARLSQHGRAPARLVVTRDGRTFRASHGRVDLSRRKALPGVLAALTAAWLDTPGSYIDVQALFAAGWPGERALHHAAAARVYMAVRALRVLGLGAALESGHAGYRIDPNAALHVLEPSGGGRKI